MKKFAIIATAATLALGAPLALAQDAMSVDEAVLAVNAAAGTVSEVENLTTVGPVTIAETASLEGDAAVVFGAIERNKNEIVDLRAAIAANTALAAAIEAEGVNIETVIGLTIGDDGAVTVYVDSAAASVMPAPDAPAPAALPGQ